MLEKVNFKIFGKIQRFSRILGIENYMRKVANLAFSEILVAVAERELMGILEIILDQIRDVLTMKSTMMKS